MVASIREFGFTVPVLARSSGEVVDGHLRLKAAAQLGISQIPIIRCDSWSEAQVKAFRLMVNRSVTWADWDMEALAAEFAELKALDFNLEMTGFDIGEIDKLTLQADPREDDVPPVPETPVSKRGDLWLMGSHRLLCGDATSAEDVGRLLGENKPFLMVTDPPYGVEYDPKWRNERLGLAFRAEATAYMKQDLEAAWLKAHELFTGDVAYVWHADRPAVDVALALMQCGFEIRNQIVWCKENYAISRGHYNSQHECCWYAVRKGRTAHWCGNNTESTFWKVNRMDDQPRTGHAAQKPVEIMRRPIRNHTKSGNGIYDPFLGSGTTLIAAESIDRACNGLELDPAFCDVIVTRWQNLTGRQATLDGDGRSFAEIKAERCPELATV